ncbi:MAG: hypothetical protein F9K26_05390 [Ignavibacteriaceae bacterium]|nr:MAG: hypothetical protein F9K26_05390 [Ignavibacteriaceae bacterium]MBV6444445.1 hypothetical protein [Ignavibacteriaceae bacterium]OQY73326.1 MAG: hypothetical protein B6D45_08270 [Ignavibacteriales bacterium UTCHB3]WKZ72108.1 MAG: hypothetical protein QY308_10815 [Ignavibacteriaceae bacterium]
MRIEIFKTGVHKPMQGEARTFTVADLDSIVAASAGKEIPAVIGHPKLADPAYGWAKVIEREGESLFAQLDQVDPGFEELVKAGRYKNISISINKDGSVRHIGFLGAVPPAVTGLKPVEFSNDAEAAEYAVGDIIPAPVESDSKKEKTKKEEEEESSTPECSASEELLRRVTAAENKVAQLEKQLLEKIKAEKQTEFAAFADAQVAEGRIKPDAKGKVINVLMHLNSVGTDGALNFAEAEPEASKIFRELIKSLPSIVTPGRIPGLQFAAGDQPTDEAKPLAGKELAQFIKKSMENYDEA